MRALLVIVTAAILGGCAGDETTARLHWSLGGQSCKEAGVKTVRVFLGPLGPGSFDRDIECAIGTSKAGAELDGVSAGRYTLVLKGFGGERIQLCAALGRHAQCPDLVARPTRRAMPQGCPNPWASQWGVPATAR